MINAIDNFITTMENSLFAALGEAPARPARSASVRKTTARKPAKSRKKAAKTVKRTAKPKKKVRKRKK